MKRATLIQAIHRWALTIVPLGLLILLPHVADAAVVRGRLTYAKIIDAAGSTEERPIAYAIVEIHYREGWWDLWDHVETARTDANGFVVNWSLAPKTNDGRCSGQYSLRVRAENYAAVVRPNVAFPSLTAFYAKPGHPVVEIAPWATSCTSVLDFTWNFSDPFAAQHYNIAEAVRRGYDYANARRDPRESDALRALAVQPSSVVSMSYFNHVFDTLMLTSGGAFDDLLILHEYAHSLEHRLSTFAPIISEHNGCNAIQPGSGNRINSAELAWMEGFADYFAQSVARLVPAGTLASVLLPGTTPQGTSSVATLESPPACGDVGLEARNEWGNSWTIRPSMIENFVAAVLWDLFDRPSDPASTLEPFDVTWRRDRAIFEIFDRELNHLGRRPGIDDFYCAWTDRGLSKIAIDLLFEERGMSKPACSAPLADRVVFRPSNGAWYDYARGGPITYFGAPEDLPVPGFYDGDGLADVAVWRPSTGNWILLNSASGYMEQQWGMNGDIPVPADYDRDGRTDFAVWRPSTGDWWIINSSTAGVTHQQWGQYGDIPVPADYDRDGRTDFAVWRPSSGDWWILTRTGQVTRQQWGTYDDVPVPADYDGDGRIDFAVWRPSTSEWWIINSSTGRNNQPQLWGSTGDIAVPADYDHDGRADIAVWRPSTGAWYIILSTTGVGHYYQWGQAGDVPIKPGLRFR